MARAADSSSDGVAAAQDTFDERRVDNRDLTTDARSVGAKLAAGKHRRTQRAEELRIDRRDADVDTRTSAAHHRLRLRSARRDAACPEDVSAIATAVTPGSATQLAAQLLSTIAARADPTGLRGIHHETRREILLRGEPDVACLPVDDPAMEEERRRWKHHRDRNLHRDDSGPHAAEAVAASTGRELPQPTCRAPAP